LRKAADIGSRWKNYLRIFGTKTKMWRRFINPYKNGRR
jgi:hypothetical protein